MPRKPGRNGTGENKNARVDFSKERSCAEIRFETSSRQRTNTKIELVLAKRPKGPRTKNNTAQKCQVEKLIALCNVAQCVQVQCVQYKRPTTRHRIILIRDWSKFLY